MGEKDRGLFLLRIFHQEKSSETWTKGSNFTKEIQGDFLKDGFSVISKRKSPGLGHRSPKAKEMKICLSLIYFTFRKIYGNPSSFQRNLSLKEENFPVFNY